MFNSANKTLQDGVLKNSLVIKSLPQRLLSKVIYGGRKLFTPFHTKNVTSDDEYAYTHHHVVYKMPPSTDFSKHLVIKINYFNINFFKCTFFLNLLLVQDYVFISTSSYSRNYKS